MITSTDNEKLKLIRKLAERKWRDRERLFVAEGEDLIATAAAAGVKPRFVLRGGEDVEQELLDGVSALGSGTRVIGVYEQRSAAGSASAGLCVYMHGLGDPGNVGAIIRTADALVDAAVVLGAGCADAFSPKAVRASMGSIFSVAVSRGDLANARGPRVGLVAHGGEALDEKPVGTVCLGAERDGLPREIVDSCDRLWTIPLREGGAESLNVAAAAAIALGRISSSALRDGETN